jgi:hypothetical protein
MPVSAKQVPVTNPTYPVPTTEIFTLPSLALRILLILIQVLFVISRGWIGYAKHFRTLAELFMNEPIYKKEKKNANDYFSDEWLVKIATKTFSLTF